MKTRDEVKELISNRYVSEITRIILFDNDSEIKDFTKWSKLELLTFYNYWKKYDDFNNQLTMKSTKQQMRIIINNIIRNMIRQLMFNNGDLTQKDMLDYMTIKRREIIINELIN